MLAVLTRAEDASWLSLRNLPDVLVFAPDQLNTYDVLINDHIVFSEEALAAFLAGPTAGKGAKAVASESEVSE